VDRALAALRDAPRPELPKGLAEATLAPVVALLRSHELLSAAEIAAEVGVSVQTVRRYLDYLAAQRLVLRAPRYGGAGRPEQVYRWGGS
jgi:response regulator of citrate/malate metabolism